MNIALITDLHIGKEGENTYGVDVRQNFRSILEAVKMDRPDHIIINGDLCLNEGEIGVYQWIKQQLDILSIPYDFTVGNHDNGQMMTEVFGLHDDFHKNCLYYTRVFNN